MPLKTYFNWSSGKDSALALYYLLNDSEYSVEHIITTISEQHQRVSMHGLRRSLLEAQLKAIGIPFTIIALPEQCSNETYENIMLKNVNQLKKEGFEYAAFGDIFLEDLKKYRAQQLEKLGIKTIFPLWKKDTQTIYEAFLNLGFEAITVAINAQKLDESFIGKKYDLDFINRLPKDVDPCGEYGEFHTFCYQSPYFKYDIPFSIGEKVYKTYHHEDKDNGYWFCDLVEI